MWKSSYFWVLLCDDGKHWNAFIHDWWTLPRFKYLFIRGKAKNHVFGSRDLSFSVVALRLNFNAVFFGFLHRGRWQLFTMLQLLGSLEPIFEKFFDTSICCLYEDICEPDYGLCFSSVF